MGNAPDLLERTKTFAMDVLRLCATLSAGAEGGHIKRQLLRAATSVGANYRAARRARSRREFVSRLSVVEEEADESIYWLELLEQLGAAPADRLRSLQSEADQLVAIMVAAKRTARLKGL